MNNKYINHEEFAKLIGVSVSILKHWRTKDMHSIPQPSKRIKNPRNGFPTPFWEMKLAINYSNEYKKRMTKDNKVIKKLADKGLTTKEISNEIGVATKIVADRCRHLGIKTSSSRKSPKKLHDKFTPIFKDVLKNFSRLSA